VTCLAISASPCLKALRRNSHLRRLNLADNKINVKGAWYIAATLSPTRPGAAGSIAGIAGLGEGYLGRQATYISALETLNLSDNPLCSKGVISIAEHLGAGGEHTPVGPGRCSSPRHSTHMNPRLLN
jgi:hypothetical protein